MGKLCPTESTEAWRVTFKEWRYTRDDQVADTNGSLSGPRISPDPSMAHVRASEKRAAAKSLLHGPRAYPGISRKRRSEVKFAGRAQRIYNDFHVLEIDE